MTISIGTFDDLKGHGEPEPIERNPSVPCAICGDGYLWQDYWKPRYVEPENADPRTERFTCDSCIDDAREEFEQYRRETENQSIADFVSGEVE